MARWSRIESIGNDESGRLSGKLLVASPELRDPNFTRTVVLILEHNDDGAVGLTLNRPIGLDVVDHLPSWSSHLSEPAAVFAGGPVEREMAIGLVWRPSIAPSEDWKPILGGLGVIDLGLDPAGVHGVEKLRVFAGYAGWGESQIELELTVGSWFVLETDPADAFVTHPEEMWRRVLARQADRKAFYALYPDEVRLN